MVYALREIWRVLVSGKFLIDLRPRSEDLQVEVVAGEQIMFAGVIDESVYLPDDVAADNAVAQIVRAGLFSQKHEARFDFAMYWDSADELKAYARDRWPQTRLPEAVLVRSRRLMAASSANVRVRIRRKMMIARYQKVI
jgi:hypothetical protein